MRVGPARICVNWPPKTTSREHISCDADVDSDDADRKPPADALDFWKPPGNGQQLIDIKVTPIHNEVHNRNWVQFRLWKLKGISYTSAFFCWVAHPLHQQFAKRAKSSNNTSLFYQLSREKALLFTSGTLIEEGEDAWVWFSSGDVALFWGGLHPS